MPAEIPADPALQYLAFVQATAARLRGAEVVPSTLAAWQQQRAALRTRLVQAWGGFPEQPCSLEAKVVGEIKRPGYRIERLMFQTRPGVWMTANAYVPDLPGKHPAVLCVHGHWKLAKQDPKVQVRCLGLVQLGYFVLCVDAWGAGERAVGKALGEYHGEMAAATTWPVGLPLSGLQVYENMRAVDYLQSRPEVDARRIGITGASGGGNQSMYAGAFDERFAAVVPVCSVGRYQSYLGAACCVCEVVPGALTFTEEWGILSLTAPRALLIINASRDSYQFSIGEARRSLQATRRIFELYGRGPLLRQATFESIHDYSQAMRETMYGWMALHLKGEGTGSPVAEPRITTEDPESLRCFPGDSRPDTYLTTPRFAAAEGAQWIARHNAEPVQHKEHWQAIALRKQHALEETVLGGFPRRGAPPLVSVLVDSGRDTTYEIETEPGIRIAARHQAGTGKQRRTALLLDLTPTGHPREPRGRSRAESSELGQGLIASGWDLLTVDLRTVGHYVVAGDTLGRAPDHNTSEWGMWIGRPLLGQWLWDLRVLLDVLAERDPAAAANVTIVGYGPAGVAALAAAALDSRIAHVVTLESLASWLTSVPYQGQRMGILAPGLVREVGDIAHLAALIAPRPVRMIGPVSGEGQPVGGENLDATFAPARRIYQLLGAGQKLELIPRESREQTLQRLK